MDHWINELIYNSYENESDAELVFELLEVVQKGDGTSEMDKLLRDTIEEYDSQ